MTRRPKGTGSIREREGGYQATYSFTDGHGNRRRRSATFATRTGARGWLTGKLAAVAGGGVADSGVLTVGDYLEDWLGSLGMAQLEAATLSWYRSAAKRHIAPMLGHVRLSKLSPVQVEAFLVEKAEKISLHTGGDLENTCPGTVFQPAFLQEGTNIMEFPV